MDLPENLEASSDGEAPPVKRSDGACIRHPTVAAIYACRQCGAPICEECASRVAGGSLLGGVLCPDCKEKQEPPPVPPLRLVAREEPDLPPPIPRSAMPPDAFCVQHPHVHASRQCKLCERYMCTTCDFSLPDGVHICPACAAAPRPALGVKGRQFLIGSFVAAIWSTVGLACLVSGALGGMAKTQANAQVLGYILFIFVLGPAIAGLGLAMTAKRPRRSNPASLWIAMVWNSVIVGCFLILTIIGLMKK